MDRTKCAVALAVCIGMIAAAGAATVEVEGHAGIGRSDNVSRTPAEHGATIRSVGARFSVLEQRRQLQADLLGDLSLLDYAGDRYSSEVIGNAAGRLRLGLMGDRLHWVVEDRFGQMRHDMLSAPSPENREHVNVFSTGPEAKLALGSASAVLLGGRYTRVNYEHSEADSERLGGWVGLERMLPGAARASLNIATERIEPRGPAVVPPYDRRTAFVRYAIVGRRTSISVDAGANQVTNNGGDNSGLMLRAELKRDVGGQSQLMLRAGQEFTDSGAALELSGEELQWATLEDVNLVQTLQPYTGRYVGADWRVIGRRTTFGLAATWSDEDYAAGAALDAMRLTLGASLERQLGVRTSIAASVNSSHNKFRAVSADDDVTYRLALSWVGGRRLRLELAGEYYDYSSDVTGKSHEMRSWLRVRYGGVVSR